MAMSLSSETFPIAKTYNHLSLKTTGVILEYKLFTRVVHFTVYLT